MENGFGVSPQNVKTDVNQLASQILRVFPELEPDSRRTAVQLYRLLGEGEVVTRDALAKAAGVSIERVNDILDGWSGVYYEGEYIVGFWGLTPKPFSKHLSSTIAAISHREGGRYHERNRNPQPKRKT